MSQTLSPEVQNLYEVYRQIKELEIAGAVLQWDQETMMPGGGQIGRGKVVGTLTGMRHEVMISNRFSDAIEACREQAVEDPALAAQVREASRVRNHASKISATLAQALAEAESAGLASWQKARKQGDFGIFRDDLALLIELVKEKASALAEGGAPYDALLDLFDPGCKEADLVPLFEGLRSDLSPLVQAVSDSGKVIDESPAKGDFSAEGQKAFGVMVAEKMGFDFNKGRLDLAAHPFCTSFYPQDVRLTWRYEANDFRPALFGIMHEAGHGLYEQGLPPEWQGTPIGDAVGMGVHESQSRMWENLVGRSKAFWHWALPLFKKTFPGHDHLTVEKLYPALHTVRPTLIRVEADEATYNLHVAARFEIERQLFAGKVEVDELPELWNQTYQELLGITPESDSDGVLQDIHWSMGAFGYFPSYTLGNLINSQLFETVNTEIPELEDQLSRGEFSPLLEWLRSKIHRHGSLFLSSELVKNATGKDLTSSYFLRHIQEVTSEVYGIGAFKV